MSSLLNLTILFVTTLYLVPAASYDGRERIMQGEPCSEKESGRTGVCMFAFDCLKANGTHLKTCMDGFYFRSCCDLGFKNKTTPSVLAMIGPISNLFDDANKGTMTKTSQALLSPLLLAIMHVSTIVGQIVKLNSSKNIENGLQTAVLLPPSNFVSPVSNSTDSANHSTNSTVEIPTEEFNETINSVEENPQQELIGTTGNDPKGPAVTLLTSIVNPSKKMNDTDTTSEVHAEFFTPNGTLLINDYKQICGRTFFGRNGRIVGGGEAAYGKWPWQISLRRRGFSSEFTHRCGAVLVTENYALTAAHCVASVDPAHILLRLGQFDMNGDQNVPYSHLDRQVKFIVTHAHFDPESFEFDIALLRFNESVTFQPNIIPICISDVEDQLEDLAYKIGHVTGWGRLYHGGPTPSKLHQLALPLLTNKVCEKMFESTGEPEKIPHIFLCAGRMEGGQDACDGDSGGPLVTQNKDDSRWILLGITSWGVNCAKPSTPGVYVRLSAVRNWVTKMLEF